MKRTAGTRKTGWMKVAVVGLLGLFALGLAAANPALADGRGHWRGSGHGSVHVDVGPLWWGPPYAYWWYPPPYYPYYDRLYESYPAVIVEQPRVYVEQPPPPAPPTEGYWYYCPSSRAYYPTVQTCPEAWVKVPPRPE